jgi:hypothetical protein
MVADCQSELAQPFPQVTQELTAYFMCDAKMAFHEAVEILAEQDGDAAVAGSPRLRGPDRIIEQTQFAEELPGVEPYQKAVLRSALPANRDFAIEDEVHRLSLLPLVEDDFPGYILADMQQAGENREFLLGQIDEQGEVTQFFKVRQLPAGAKKVKQHGAILLSSKHRGGQSCGGPSMEHPMRRCRSGG